MAAEHAVDGAGCANYPRQKGRRAGRRIARPQPGSDGNDVACYLAAFAISSCIFARSLYSLAADS